MTDITIPPASLEAALRDIADWEVDHIGAARELARAALGDKA